MFKNVNIHLSTKSYLSAHMCTQSLHAVNLPTKTISQIR